MYGQINNEITRKERLHVVQLLHFVAEEAKAWEAGTEPLSLSASEESSAVPLYPVAVSQIPQSPKA